METKLSYIKFRCTCEEKMAIFHRARKAGYSMSEFCRQQAISGKVHEVPKLSEQMILYFRYLIHCKTSLARISNYMKNKSPELSEEIRTFLAEFKRAFYMFFPEK